MSSFNYSFERQTLVNAEFGTCAPMAIMNKSQVFGSNAACLTWYHLNWLLLTPCRLIATRSTAIALSRSVRNLAVDGRSGRKTSATTPTATENAPNIRNTYIHLGRPVVMCPTAYPISLHRVSSAQVLCGLSILNTYPPNIVAIPLVQYQASSRRGCSSVVYHILIIRTNPGVTTASTIPKRKRLIAIPAKLWHAGVVMSRPPHTVHFSTVAMLGYDIWFLLNVVIAIYFPTGSFCNASPAGHWAMRYPK